jgi:hypothetical protein
MAKKAHIEKVEHGGKWCKLNGWVAVNYDCEDCKLCGGKE